MIDLTDLRLNCGVKNKDRKKLLGKRDKRVTKATRLKSLDGNKAQAFIKCYECNTRQCIYARTGDVYMAAMG